MAQKLEDLVLRIEADAAELRKGLGQAERQVGASAGRMRSSFEKVGPALARLGALATGAGVGLALISKRSLDSADALGKASDRIGIQTEELQKLRFAADLAGVSGSQLDKSLEQLVKRLGEAATGRGTLVETLKDLDPTLLEALGGAESTGEAFLLLADAISGTEDPTRRAAIGNAAFGRSWAALVNLLAGGREGIAASGEELERFGAVYSREAAAGAEAVNDALLELATFASTSFTAALLGANGEVRTFAELLRDPRLRTAVGDLGEGLGTLARALAEIAAQAGAARAGIQGLAFRFGGVAGIDGLETEDLEERLRVLREIERVRENPQSVGDYLKRGALLPFPDNETLSRERVASEIQRIDAELARRESAGQEPDFSAQLRALGFDASGNPIRPPPAVPAPPRLGGFGLPTDGSSASSRSGPDPLKAALDRLREEEELRANALEDFRRLEQDVTRESLELADDRIGIVRLETEARLAQLEELARVLPGREAEIADARAAIVANGEAQIRQELEETKGEGAKVFEELTDLAASTLGDFFANQLLRDADVSFSEIAKSFAATLIRMQVEAAASGIADLLKPDASSASSSSGGAGGFLGGLLGPLLGGLGSFFGPGMAEGGIVTRPTRALIGEGGEAEAVLPLSRLRGMLGDVGAPVVNVINQSGTPLAVSQATVRRTSRGTELDVAVEASWNRAASQGAFRDALGRRHRPGVG